MQGLLRKFAAVCFLYCSGLAAILLQAGCLYVPVRVTHEVTAPRPAGEEKRLYEKKYFAMVLGFSPAARANNRGVGRAVEGNFPEAIELFRVAMDGGGGMPEPYNNSAIIYEISGHREEAFAMYMKACLMDPGNKTYRSNFLYFNDTKK